jgi:hypothetical protein
MTRNDLSRQTTGQRPKAGRPQAPEGRSPASPTALDTDEYGVPVARSGDWLPDFDDDFEIVDDS